VICNNNQATIVATGLIWPAPSHHVWDTLHKRLDMVKRMHRDMALTIQWTPGHVGIAGNKAADVEAKEASHTGSSPANRLLAPLRHTLPHSKSATVQEFHRKPKQRAVCFWRKSERYTQMRDIDPSIPSSKYWKAISGLPCKHASLLTQLYTGHVPLNAHLHHIGKAETPLCPACHQHEETVHHYIL
jgi:hypothetical protein